MGMLMPSSFQDHFASLTDPRCPHAPNQRHPLIDMLVIAVCAVICGADGWEDIEEYGQAQVEWFAQLLELPHGIPSHDTFRRVLSCLDPEELTQCFMSWTGALSELSGGDIVAIDGKTLRHSFDRATSKAAIHMVSAWANANRLVLGQVKVDDKSNEITAIPKLLEMLELAGATVTIDAMGCQKDIAQSITDQGADYVLALEKNHKTLLTMSRCFSTGPRPRCLPILPMPIMKRSMGTMVASKRAAIGSPRIASGEARRPPGLTDAALAGWSPVAKWARRWRSKRDLF